MRRMAAGATMLRQVPTAAAPLNLRDGSAIVMLARGCCLNAVRGCGSKMENAETYRHRKSDGCGLSAASEWLGKHPQVLGQRNDRRDSVLQYHLFQRPDPAAAFDRLLNLQELDCTARFLGHLVERQQVRLPVEEIERVGKGDSLELAHNPLDRDLGCALDAVLVGAHFVENPFVMKQPMGVHCGRRGGVAGADSSLCPI